MADGEGRGDEGRGPLRSSREAGEWAWIASFDDSWRGRNRTSGRGVHRGGRSVVATLTFFVYRVSNYTCARSRSTVVFARTDGDG